MYFQHGQICVLLQNLEPLIGIRSSADRLLIACCSETCLDLWRSHYSTRLFRYQRSEESVKEYGKNKSLHWRTDSTGLAVITDSNFIILFEVKHDHSTPLSYQCYDNKTGTQLHEGVGTVPSLVLDATTVVNAEHEVTALTGLSNDLMLFTTKGGALKQFYWDDGLVVDAHTCHVSQLYFTDPSEHSYTPDNNIHISSMCYSHTLNIAAVTFSNGRGAYLSSSDLFKPGTVHALLAPHRKVSTSASINPRYNLIAFGTEDGEIFVYVLNYDNGLLNLSHTVRGCRDVAEGDGSPDKSKVIKLFWTPDCCCLCGQFESGTVYLWSVYGSALYSNKRSVMSGAWDLEGYNLWAISDVQLFKIPFLKSPLTVNNVTNNQQHIILQSANQVFILPNRFPPKSGLSVYGSIYVGESEMYDTPYQSFIASLGSPLENWPWQVIQVPDIYANTNCPVRFVSIGASGQCTAVAGSRGFAFYISAKHKWRCFGNEAQEQSMVVRGGMVWWHGVLIVGAYHPADKLSRIYMYPHHNSIDQSSVICTIPLSASIITLNTHEDFLAVVTGANRVIVYLLGMTVSPNLNIDMSYQKVLEFSINKYTPHPCAVLSVHVSPLSSDACVPANGAGLKSVMVNVAGKLFMFEINDEGDVSKPVTVATNVESVTCPTKAGQYLSAAPWLNCGSRGVKVWLPLHGTKEDLGSRRTLITVKQSVYPLVVHHQEAAILGIPVDSLRCRSETFLHILLHQLVVKNLEKHAYSIAKMCDNLPYFHHTLELMIHKALESDMSHYTVGMVEEAVLPHVIRFMRKLPHYLSAVAHCARKTEMTQWEYLFQSTGLVTDLLDECLSTQSLDTAILYLVILQNLHPLHVSRKYIVRLLEASISQNRWDLGVDLLRFLHVISTDNEKYPGGRQKKLTGQSELAIRLRRSSESYEEDPPMSPATPGIENVSYDMLTNPPDDEAVSDKKRAQRIITHHAHKLLKSCQFFRLGEMCYHLNFDLLQFLEQEKGNVGEVDDPAHVFMSIHEEFHWPYPDIIPRILAHPSVSDNINVVSVSTDSEARECTETDEKVDFISDSVSLYEGSVYSECRVEIDPTILAEALKRGTPESEDKLKYFLKMFYDAGVYNYALLFALVLRDVEMIAAVVKKDPSPAMLSMLMAIDCWGHQESGGYSLFLQSLKPLIAPIFPTTVNDLKLKPLVKLGSMSSLTSSNSNNHDKVPSPYQSNLDINHIPHKEHTHIPHKEHTPPRTIVRNSVNVDKLQDNMHQLSVSDQNSNCVLS